MARSTDKFSKAQIMWTLGLIVAIAGPIVGWNQSQMSGVIERTEAELVRQADREQSCEELLRETLRLLHQAGDEGTGEIDPAHASAIGEKMADAARCLEIGHDWPET